MAKLRGDHLTMDLLAWVPMNEALARIDAIVQLSVISNVLTAPPASPALGARYIIATPATGAWAGWEDSIAAYIGGAWVRIMPANGWMAWVESESSHFKYDGSWAEFVTIRTEGFGVSFGGTPTSSEMIGALTYPLNITCPPNLAGSFCTVGTAPTASFDIDVQDDGVSIGTITIATGGTSTFTSAGGLAVNIVAGSRITFHTPATVDATIADIAPTITGEV